MASLKQELEALHKAHASLKQGLQVLHNARTQIKDLNANVARLDNELNMEQKKMETRQHKLLTDLQEVC